MFIWYEVLLILNSIRQSQFQLPKRKPELAKREEMRNWDPNESGIRDKDPGERVCMENEIYSEQQKLWKWLI